MTEWVQESAPTQLSLDFTCNEKNHEFDTKQTKLTILGPEKYIELIKL